jgi:TIR domain
MSARYALLIGSSSYEDPGFRESPSAAVDIQRLASLLEDPEIGDFEVATHIDPTWAQAQVHLARFCTDREPEDVLLIYFTGLAALDAHDNLYLCLRDTDRGLLAATGVSASFLLGLLESCRAERKVLILESVYSGAVLRGVLRIPEGLVILAASGPQEYAFESTEQDANIFTYYLTEGLRTGEADINTDGDVTFEELLAYTKRRVEAREEGQRPRLFNLAEYPIVAAKVARHIFISYSRADTIFATDIRDKLISSGHKAWMDESSISGGEDWHIRIGAAIDEAKAVVAILSPDALGSTWVRRELNYADKMGKPIFPIICKQSAIPGWYELQFGDLQRLDFTGANQQKEFETLLNSIQRTLRLRSLSEGSGP